MSQIFEIRKETPNHYKRITITIKRDGSFVFRYFKENYPHVVDRMKKIKNPENAGQLWTELIEEGYHRIK